MGIPAIGTQVGGIPDLILDGQTGYLLPEKPDPADVAAAIVKFAALPEQQKGSMAAAAREHWKEKFDAKENAMQFAAYLQKLTLE